MDISQSRRSFLKASAAIAGLGIGASNGADETTPAKAPGYTTAPPDVDKLVVGVFQGRCSNSKPERNWAKTEQIIDEAGKAGCDFISFPETFLTGSETREHIESHAITVTDKRLADLAKRAADRKVVAIVGFSERRDGKFFNTQAVLDGGKVAGTYSKTMPTHTEYQIGYCAADNSPVFNARGVCFAIQICYDTYFPEIASNYSWKGARLLFAPHAVLLSQQASDENRIRCRNSLIGSAVHYNLAVARANYISCDDFPNLIGYGDSFILSPLGVPLAEAGLFVEKMIVADVAPSWKAPRYGARTELREPLINEIRDNALAAIRAKQK